MTEEQALECFKNPEKIVSPEDCNFVISYLTGWISDCEEELNERNFQVSVKHGELYAQSKKVGLADRELETTDIYRDRERLKLKLAQLKRHRQDLKDRFNVLTQRY